MQKGGTLVTLGDASIFAIDRLGLSIRNATAGKVDERVLVPRLDAESEGRECEPTGLWDAGGCAGGVSDGQSGFRFDADGSITSGMK